MRMHSLQFRYGILRRLRRPLVVRYLLTKFREHDPVLFREVATVITNLIPTMLEHVMMPRLV